jgi:molybdopterin-containing oxidoreductase family iron-sulfur binding subunit
MVPMCVSTCICRANYFGDPEDTKSLIHKMIKENKVTVLAEVSSKGQAKLKDADLKDRSPSDIAGKIGYPGTTPSFAGESKTKPRVYYILP